MTTDTALSAGARAAVRDLILVLADNKRLLGMRYADWMLGAPELESGIACSSMAQDEWGHARQLYALLKDFDLDVSDVEHGRGAGEYRSMEVLDVAPADWAGLIALNVLVDGALSEQFEALRSSSYTPLRQRVEKLLEEERFHAAHGAAWLRRLATSGDEGRASLEAALRSAAEPVLRWFGPDSDRAKLLGEEAVVDGTGDALRRRFIDRMRPLLSGVGLESILEDAHPDFAEFDEARRRSGSAGPDEVTMTQVRGDKNRDLLMD